MSVCPSGLGGNVIFSAPNWDIAPIFFVQIPLKNEHLFCKYFVICKCYKATTKREHEIQSISAFDINYISYPLPKAMHMYGKTDNT